jgi:hypothetical protein
MKKTLYLLFTATVFTALLLGCGKETQSSTQGGGIFKLRVNINPPLQYGSSGVSGSQYNLFQIISPAGTTLWMGNSQSVDLSSWESPEISVTKGQNLPVTVGLNDLKDLKCHQVKIDGLIDNKVIKSVVLELGQTSLNPIVQCKDVNNTNINFIVP